MPDTKTQISTVSDIVQNAYDELALFKFQAQSYYDGLCDIERTPPGGPTPQKGQAVYFTIYDDLTAATTALTEITDVDAVAMAENQVSVTLYEYGNAILTTKKLEELSYMKVVQDATTTIANNMAESLDKICRATAQAGTNVEYAGSILARNQLLSTSTITAAKVEKQRAELRDDEVPPVMGDLYASIISSKVAYDLKRETGTASWRVAKDYVDAAELKTFDIGVFGGFRFLESSRAPLWADGGSSTVDAYGTLFCGFQALGKGVGVAPKIVFGPITDKLMRFRPIGWYALQGYGRIREDSLRRLETASSIGSNS